ncbi:MAG TPA: transporter substrate-binding domain-containing protein [Methanomicrobiales archaeon]|nr:transporter substrate-binding domain-containing protein [Methanomicrobiales archaeon]
MKGKGYFIVVLCFVLAVAFTCGCSTQGPSAGTGVSPTPTGPATDAGLRIVTEDFPPFNYAGPDGKAAGLSTDVVNAILARLNQKAAIEVMPWTGGYQLALSGPRVVLFSTGRTDERETLFKWVGPIAANDYTLYARKGSALQIGSLEAAKKAGLIGVVKDDARYQFLLENRFGNILTCDDETGCIRNLTAGTTGLLLGSSLSTPDIARKAGIDPSSLDALYTIRTVPLYIAFSRDTPDSVIAAWQGALDAMKRDGSFDAILAKYGMTPSGITVSQSTSEAQAGLALEIVAAETDGQLKAVLRPLEVLAATTEAQSGGWQNIRPLLAVLEEKEPAILAWYALPDGSYYTVDDGLTSANLKNRSYFPVVLAGNESVGIVVVSKATGRNVAVVAVPVKAGGGVTGVLGSSVYLDTLTDTLREEIPAPFVFYAIDTEHKFALHSEKGQITRNIATIGPGSSFGQAISTILAGDSGTVEYDDGGIHYTARFSSDPLTGWRLVVAWPKAGSTTTTT